MDILITGANGQLGFEATRQSAIVGLNTTALTRQEFNVADQDAVNSLVGRLRPKVILNAAAYTAVDKAESEEPLAFEVNENGPKFLAQAAEKIGATLLHVSTDYVFDGTKHGPYTEDDPVAPLGVYGRSKEAGEQAIRKATNKHIILRTSWVFGTHGANFVKTMLRLGAERDALNVVDDQWGSPTYAADLAAAILILAGRAVADELTSDGYGTFHCAGGGKTSWCGFARTIFELSEEHIGKRPAVNAIPTSEYPTPAKRPANSVLNCDRLKQIHGLQPNPWPNALSRMLSSLHGTQ